MSTRNPFELIIALVGGVGTDFTQVYHELKSSFDQADCDVERIKITDYLKKEEKKDYLRCIDEKIEKMNVARKKCGESVAAYISIAKIFSSRLESLLGLKTNNAKPKIYVIDSLKHPSAYKILRNVYRRNFILLSIYQDKNKRKQFLQNEQLRTIEPENLSESEINHINELMLKDEDEKLGYGRNTINTYHKAHYFIRMDHLNSEINRFVRQSVNGVSNLVLILGM